MPRSIITTRKRSAGVKRSPSADILSDSCEDERPIAPKKRRVCQKKEDLLKPTIIIKQEKTDNPCTSLATFSDFGSEMTKIFHSLGSTMQNNFRAKKKRLEEYTADLLKLNQAKISKLSQHQLENRKQLLQKLQQNAKTIFEEWECDLVDSRNEEKNMMKTIHQYFRKSRDQHKERVEKLRILHKEYEDFIVAIYDQEDKHAEEYNNIGEELEKDLVELRNKMLMKTQQDEMCTVENSLKSVLFV